MPSWATVKTDITKDGLLEAAEKKRKENREALAGAERYVLISVLDQIAKVYHETPQGGMTTIHIHGSEHAVVSVVGTISCTGELRRRIAHEVSRRGFETHVDTDNDCMTIEVSVPAATE